MISEKVLTLNNVLHFHTIKKNSASVVLLIKNGFKCVLVSDKSLISNNVMFLWNGYLIEGIFKLNVIFVDGIKKNYSSIYLLDSNDLCHVCSGHVIYYVLRKLITLEVLHDFKCDKLKCEIYGKCKFVKQPYKSVTRNSKPEDLFIHIYIHILQVNTSS